MKSSFFFSITFLLLSTLGFSQNQQKIDSVLAIINSSNNDSIKASNYLKLVKFTIHNNPKKAFSYVDSALSIYQKMANGKGIAKSLTQKANYYYTQSNYDSARYYLNKSVNTILPLGDTLHAASIRSNIGILDIQSGNLESGIEIMNTNIPIFKKYKDSMNLGKAYLLKGKAARLKGFYEIALKECYKALNLHEEIKNDYRTAEDLFIIGLVHQELEQYKKAKDIYERCSEIYAKIDNQHTWAQVLNFIGYMNIMLNELPTAEENFKEALTTSKKLGYKANVARTTIFMGRLEYEKKNYDAAIDKFNEGIEIWKTVGSAYHEAGILRRIGDAYLAKKEYNNSLNYLNKSIQLCDSLNYPVVLRDAYFDKSTVLEKLNNHSGSLNSFKKGKAISDSIFNIDQRKKIEELNIIYETEKKEAALALQKEEIKTLNTQTENDRLTKTLYGGGTIAGVALSGLLFFGFRQRMKKNRIERERQEEIYKQEIAFKQKELASQTLHLVQKNTFLQELKENLEKLKNSPEKFKVEFRRIVMLLKKENAGDKDWEVFKSYFSEVHDNFDNKLKAINKDISEKDLRLASFIKMNLTTKEIAAILNVLPQSVLTSKYRLKKKLNISKEEDVYNFLMKI